MSAPQKILPQEKFLFEDKDLALFKIPDIKTRLNTIQNYFFPRLDKLLIQTVELIQEIYEVNPYDRLTILRTPNHRKDAKKNKSDLSFIRIGLGGKRRNEQPLKVLNKSGKPYWIPSSRLYYNIEPTGEMFVYLYLLGYIKYSLNLEFLATWRTALIDHILILNNIFLLNHISHGHAGNFIYFTDLLHPSLSHHLESDSLQFISVRHYFPIRHDSAFLEMKMAFVSLYPLLHVSLDCELGQPFDLTSMLEKHKNWYLEKGIDMWENQDKNMEATEDN